MGTISNKTGEEWKESNKHNLLYSQRFKTVLQAN